MNIKRGPNGVVPEFRFRVQSRMRVLRLKQADLRARMSTGDGRPSVGQVKAWCNADSEPSLFWLGRIARALGVTIDWLVLGEGRWDDAGIELGAKRLSAQPKLPLEPRKGAA